MKILYDLCKADTEFAWTDAHEQCFKKSKQLMLSNVRLVHYDPKLPLYITCDASGYGVGAVLSHGDDKPIVFASSTLSNAEKKYSNLERENIAIVFALKKFYKYIFGREVIIITDQ